jgi:hypothetical protein
MVILRSHILPPSVIIWKMCCSSETLIPESNVITLLLKNMWMRDVFVDNTPFTGMP